MYNVKRIEVQLHQHWIEHSVIKMTEMSSGSETETQ